MNSQTDPSVIPRQSSPLNVCIVEDIANVVEDVGNLQLNPAVKQLPVDTQTNCPLNENKSHNFVPPIPKEITFDLSAYEHLAHEMDLVNEDEDLELDLNTTYSEKTMGQRELSLMLTALQESDAMIEAENLEDNETNHTRKRHIRPGPRISTACRYKSGRHIQSTKVRRRRKRRPLQNNKRKLSFRPSRQVNMDLNLVPDCYEDFLAQVKADLK